MKNLRFLVTAGNTREKIDEVRDWGNIFSGNTGYSIARSLSKIGNVDVLTSNTQHQREITEGNAESTFRAFSFRSHADLIQALERRVRLNSYDGIFMTAAVADYSPARVYEIIRQDSAADSDVQTWIVRDVQAGKVKSSHEAIAILGTPTRKIIDCFRHSWGYQGMLVKFKLEVGISRSELISIGQRSRIHSGADFLVANTLDMVDGNNAGAYLLSDSGHEWIPRVQLADRLALLALSFGNHSSFATNVLKQHAEPIPI